MPVIKRKREPRRSRQHGAWIRFDDDVVRCECQVLDVSMNGAKLTADIPVAVGCRLRLSAMPHALEQQHCKVVWRRGKTFGVQFIKP
jgi:hypothetical protein